MKRKLLLSTALTFLVSPLILGGQVLAVDNPATGSPMDSTVQFAVTDTEDPDNPDNGKLVLKSVPSFNFGTLPASKIYNGFNNQPATADGTLTIADNRLGSEDWKLNVEMTAFSTAGSETLSDAALSLAATSTGWTDIAATAVTDTDGAVTLASGDGSVHGSHDYRFVQANNTLSLGANTGANLAAGDLFQSTLTWTLTSTGPVAPSA